MICTQSARRISSNKHESPKPQNSSQLQPPDAHTQRNLTHSLTHSIPNAAIPAVRPTSARSLPGSQNPLHTLSNPRNKPNQRPKHSALRPPNSSLHPPLLCRPVRKCARQKPHSMSLPKSSTSASSASNAGGTGSSMKAMAFLR